MRWLAVCAVSMAAAVFAANYILPPVLVLFFTALFSVLGVLSLVLRKGKGLNIPLLKRQISPRALRALGCGLVSAALGLTVFTVNYFLTTARAESFAGQSYDLRCRLVDYPREYEDYCRAEVVLCTDGLPEFRAVLYDSNKDIVNAEPGQLLSFNGKLSSADTRFGEDYDYYNSVGIFFTVNSRSEISISDLGFDIRVLPVKINRFIAGAVSRCFPEDTAAFMKSLMLGDKTELYERTADHIALSHAGLMHIVAVSGMHIAFMMEIIRVLFGKSAKSSVAAIVLVWLFVFVTGMSPSAIRAAIMQSFILLAPILRRENDPLTSLSAALALILLFNPYAATSVSLQLSFAATAGILILAPVFSRGMLAALPEALALRLRPVVQIVACSAAGIAVTSPLVALHFGYISIYSILANVLVLPVVSLCFCAGYVAAALAVIFLPLGKFVAIGVSFLARYILWAAGFVSSLPLSVVYLENALVWAWVILCYALFIICARNGKGFMLRFVMPLVLSVLCLVLASNALRLSYSMGSGVITALDVGQGQCICVFSGKSTLMIDCGGIGSGENAGERANAYLRSCGRDNVDVLILTHLHSDHVNGVERLCESIDIGTIVIPANAPDDEGYYEKFTAAANKHGINLVLIDEDNLFSLSGISALLYKPMEEGNANERCMMVRLSIGTYDMLVTGDADKAAEQALCDKHELSGTELLIVGHHGSRYSSCGELLAELGGDTAIISVGYNNYGHPTYETLERIKAYGYNIYRTDLSGNIEIRIK